MSLSPDARPGSQRSCCSGVPATWIGIAPSAWTATISPDVAHTRLICSIARHRVRRSAPSPPCCSANGIPRMSWLAEQPSDVLGPGGVPVDVGGSGGDLLVGQLAHRIAQEDLVLREADRAVGRGVRRHRNAS